MIGAIKSSGQKDLADDGKRDWDDGLRSGLDREYPDWKDLRRTYMVPPSFKSKGIEAKGERAEETMYDNLRELGVKNDEPMFVVHSVDFSEHVPDYERKSDYEWKRSWVMGEFDFVVIHREHGPIFFEVKATETGDKYKEAEAQVRKNKIVLENFCKKMLKGKISGKKITEVFKNCPGFVVMPNCPRGQSSCTRDNALYQEDCSSAEKFSVWWNEKMRSSKHPPLDQTIFEHLVMRFVGGAHVGPPLSISIDKSHNVLTFKTQEQLQVLLNSTPEQWITGPAGSGKTWVLMEKVKILATTTLLRDTREKILVACYSKPLSKMFEKTFEQDLINFLPDGTDLSSVLEVKTFDKLICDITGSKLGDSDQEKEKHVETALTCLEKDPVFIQQYDHIFVDECQDLCGDKWPILFRKLQKNDDDDDNDDDGEPKHVWFLYDTNQYLRLSERQHRQHKKTLKKSTKLSKVLRNTENVFQQSRKYYKSTVTEDPSLGHREIGLEIRWDGSLRSTAITEGEGVEPILKHIRELCGQKVQERDVCILVKNAEIRDRLSSELQHAGVQSQNAETLYEEDQSKIIVESIWRFKGLESKVVVLYNPPFCEVKDWSVKRTNEFLYTAVSRCFCYLVVITTKLGCSALQSKEGIGTLDERTRSVSQQGRTGLYNSEDLQCEKRSQLDALFNKSFGKRSLDTKYESGPPESPTKRHFGDEDVDDNGDKDEAKYSPPKVSRMEQAQMHQQHKMSTKACEKRPMEVPGCKLLEPGDLNIRDAVRNNVFNLLNEAVKQNLQLIPSSSDMDQSSLDVTSVVARIEYEVYCGRRRECNPRNYTKDLRNLKREIDKCNKTGTSHERVARACREVVAHSKGEEED